MARFRPENCVIDRATDRHGIHEVAGPLLAGGVSLIGWRTGLLGEDEVRHALTDERRFRAHLEFRERAFRLVAPVLYAAAKSPVDLFRLIDSDVEQFDTHMVEHIMIRHSRHDGSSSLLRRRPAAADGDGSDGIGDAIDDGDDRGGSSGIGANIHDGGDSEIGGDKISIMRYLPRSIIRDIEDDQKRLYVQCCDAQRYFACWKLLMKLDFIQPDSDVEDVLEKLKSSTIWPGLKHDSDLRRCLEGYMYFLKGYEKSRMGTVSSISEYESAALEEINSELSSLLHNHLDDYDWMLMEQYYDRVKLRQLARECATQARTIGVILVGEALPINPQVRTLPLIKRIQGRFRTGAASRRPWQLLAALATLATVTTAGGLRGMLRLDSERSRG
uniref:Uncharacterized protein n=1 Tax=Avena sativa TaxID=4498 RepID=A0ACD5Z4E2_AVESA